MSGLPCYHPILLPCSRINLKMKHDTAAAIVALRPALEAMIVKATINPEGIADPDPLDAELMAVIRGLSKISSGKFGIVTPESE